MKKTIGFVLSLMLSFSGCRKTPEPTPEPKPQERPKIQSFVPPKSLPSVKATCQPDIPAGVPCTSEEEIPEQWHPGLFVVFGRSRLSSVRLQPGI
jgi:hypothetical protein